MKRSKLLKKTYLLLLVITCNSLFSEEVIVQDSNLNNNISQPIINQSKKIAASPIEGIKLYELKKYRESILSLKKFLQSHPKDSKSLQYIILSYINLSKVDTAIEYLTQNSDDILSTYSSTLQFLISKEKWNDATIFVKNILSLYPNQIQMLDDYSLLLQIQQKDTIFLSHKILNTISKHKDISSNEQNILIKTISQLGLFYLKKNDIAKSISLYEKLKMPCSASNTLQMNNILLLSSLYLQVERIKDAHITLLEGIKCIQKKIKQNNQYNITQINNSPKFLQKYYLTFLKKSIYLEILLEENKTLLPHLKYASSFSIEVIQNEPVLHGILLFYEKEYIQAKHILSKILKENNDSLETLVSSLLLSKITSKTTTLYTLVQKIIYLSLNIKVPNLVPKVNQILYKHFQKHITLEETCKEIQDSNQKKNNPKNINLFFEKCSLFDDILLQYISAQEFLKKEQFSYFIWYAQSILHKISSLQNSFNKEKLLKPKETFYPQQTHSFSTIEKKKNVILSIQFEIYSILGYIYNNKKGTNIDHLHLSQSYYELLAKKFHDNPEIHLILTKFWYYHPKQNNYEIAFQHLNNYFNAFKKEQIDVPAYAYFYKALILDKIKSNSFKEIEVLLKKSIKKEPYNADFLNYLGYSYLLKNVSLEQAEVYLQRAITLEPENSAYLDSIGWLKYHQKNYDDALNFLKKAKASSKTRNNTLIICFHLGKTYESINQLEKALNYYKIAFSIIQNIKNKNNEITLDQIQQNIQRIEKRIY